MVVGKQVTFAGVRGGRLVGIVPINCQIGVEGEWGEGRGSITPLTPVPSQEVLEGCVARVSRMDCTEWVRRMGCTEWIAQVSSKILRMACAGIQKYHHIPNNEF